MLTKRYVVRLRFAAAEEDASQQDIGLWRGFLMEDAADDVAVDDDEEDDEGGDAGDDAEDVAHAEEDAG